jgi:hypothetical protein
MHLIWKQTKCLFCQAEQKATGINNAEHQQKKSGRRGAKHAGLS